MENLHIEGNHGEYFVPTIDFDAENGICELSGESYLEETREFYNPLMDWLKKYDEEKTKPLTVNFRLTYFNTSSSRCILDMLNLLKEMSDKGVVVNWYYQEDDEDMQEEVEDFIFDSQVDINMIPFDE